ncbi:hypothetical protein, partial [Salmonella enterica]|uniref:hypothetical protein n=1 Tax=Salmonella enterica TaxID=28901 RepID=UPI0019D637CE
AELADGGGDPQRVAGGVDPAQAGWGESIRVRIEVSESAAIPFIGSWAVPLSAEFVTRSEVSP